MDEIINKQEFSVKNFFRLIEIGMQEILGIKLNYRKLSANYLTKKNLETNKGNKWYANDRILESLRFENYALPTASLNQFKRNIVEIFKEKSAFFEYLIELYKSINPWSHKFSEQSNIITDYFKNINILEKAYWLGFLLAEGTIKIRGNSKMFSMALGALDLEHIIKFCKSIGFDYRKLRYDRKVGKYGQTLREFYLSFTDAKFCQNLINNGFPENGLTSYNPNLGFPYWISSDKRFAMAMLLGFFDGDGSHGLEFPNMRKPGDKGLTPIIKISSRQCLDDIKEFFNIKNDVKEIGKDFELTLDKEVFNDLLLNYDKSLERKRHKYTDQESKLKFTKDELKELYNKGWYNQKIADYHLSKYGIEISDKLVWIYAKKWNLQKDIGCKNKVYWKEIKKFYKEKTIELLKEGWNLEEIYTKEFGFSYKPQNHHEYNRLLTTHFKEWFADDPLVKDSNDLVSLRKIVETYGELENNPLIYPIEKDRVILRRKEGWSLEKIYIEELGYAYYPSDSRYQSRLRKKFMEIFKDDPLIIGNGDILKKIEEVYNPNNKL